jgi:hypothetical protein
MEIKINQLQQAWLVSIIYIIIGVLCIYTIDLIFWIIKQILKGKWKIKI